MEKGHYDVKIKRWMKKVALLCAKLKGWMDKGGAL